MATMNCSLRVRIRFKWFLYVVGALAIMLDSERLMNWACERCVKVEAV